MVLLLGFAAFSSISPAFGIDIDSKDSLQVQEGSLVFLDVKLDSDPSGTVTVSVSNPDLGAITVSPASLEFTSQNWDTEENFFEVEAIYDTDTTNENVMITLEGTGLTSKTVEVFVRDNNSVLVLPQAPVTVTEGSTTVFEISADPRPLRDFTVDVSSGDIGAATVSPESMEFTTNNWNMPQKVTVEGVEDPNFNNESVTITLSAQLFNYPVTVEVKDNDSPPVIPENLGGGDNMSGPQDPCDTSDSETSTEERTALTQLYEATGGEESWTYNDNWKTSVGVNQWHGVMTNDAGRVTELILGNNGLTGGLPDELEDLACLENLDVSDNPDLGGELPLSLMDLSELATLYIGGTGLCAPEETDFQVWLQGIDTFPDTVDVCVADVEEEEEEKEEENTPGGGGGCALASYAQTQTANGDMSTAFGWLLAVLILLAAVSPKRHPGARTAGSGPDIGRLDRV